MSIERQVSVTTQVEAETASDVRMDIAVMIDEVILGGA